MQPPPRRRERAPSSRRRGRRAPAPPRLLPQPRLARGSPQRPQQQQRLHPRRTQPPLLTHRPSSPQPRAPEKGVTRAGEDEQRRKRGKAPRAERKRRSSTERSSAGCWRALARTASKRPQTLLMQAPASAACAWCVSGQPVGRLRLGFGGSSSAAERQRKVLAPTETGALMPFALAADMAAREWRAFARFSSFCGDSGWPRRVSRLLSSAGTAEAEEARGPRACELVRPAPCGAGVVIVARPGGDWACCGGQGRQPTRMRRWEMWEGERALPENRKI